MIPKRGKRNTKLTQNVPNGHKIFQMSVKYSKWPKNITTFFYLGRALPNLHKLGFLV
jgi:hypothetical protein